MVFETYTQSIPCTVKKNMKYELDLISNDEVQRIDKHDIKYCYKQNYEQAVVENIQFDEKIKAQKLEAIIPRKDRYRIKNEFLLKAKKEKKEIRVVLRGGEIIVGTITWFSPYEIKVEFPSGKLIVFRHAVYDFSIPGEKIENESLYTNPNSTTYHLPGCRYLSRDAVSITKSEAEEQSLKACSVCKPNE